MSQFHTRSQKRASKILSRRNDEVMKFVSDQLRDYDADPARAGQAKDHTARDTFAKMCLTRAQATIAIGKPVVPDQSRG